MKCFRSNQVILLAAVLVLALLAACTGTAPVEPKSSVQPTHELGPYPMNVVVSVGRSAFTLTQVHVQPADAIAGSDSYPNTSDTRARPGHRFVRVTLVEHDNSVDPGKTGAANAAKSVIASFTATADGIVAPAVGGGGSTSISDPTAIERSIQFEFPDTTKEALLHVRLSIEGSQTIAFKLW